MKTQKNKIFVQIAAYRDPELVPTIKSCIENAKKPQNLVFCIAWQHSTDDLWDNLDEFKNDDRFIILDIPYSQTKGTCWARNLIQSNWKGEEYTLHIDSHHRFEKNWDSTLIKMVKELKAVGHDKPLLSAYVPSYDPSNDPQGRAREPWWLTFDRFTPQGVIFFKPSVIPNWKDRTLPYPGRFISGHFLFTLGQFCTEVPHDPNLLFHGEEISLSARAYTWGYDIFAPHKVVIWHEYSRNHRPNKSWGDIADWASWDDASLARNRRLLNIDGERISIDEFEEYGFGNIRSLDDYETYSGIKFEIRAVTQAVLDNLPPSDSNGPYFRIFKHCIDIPYSLVPHNDYTFWAVAFLDSEGNEVARMDADVNEIKRMKSDPDGYCKLWREFHCNSQPKKWVIWPHSTEHGWGDRMEGNL